MSTFPEPNYGETQEYSCEHRYLTLFMDQGNNDGMQPIL